MATPDYVGFAKATLERIRLEAEKRTKERREGRKHGELSRSLEEKLRACNPQQLREVKSLCSLFLKDHRRPPEQLDCRKKYARKILASVGIKNVRYQLEFRDCGKHCGTCPHGPYLYAYHRDGAIIKQKYFKKGDFRRVPRKIRFIFVPLLNQYK
jgi:hypothetical protein